MYIYIYICVCVCVCVCVRVRVRVRAGVVCIGVAVAGIHLNLFQRQSHNNMHHVLALSAFLHWFASSSALPLHGVLRCSDVSTTFEPPPPPRNFLHRFSVCFPKEEGT